MALDDDGDDVGGCDPPPPPSQSADATDPDEDAVICDDVPL